MAIEDFTTYDETDEGDDVTVTANKVSGLNLGRNETFHVSASKGPSHFDGDFVHKFECQITNYEPYSFCAFWAVANEQQDYHWLRENSADFQCFLFYDSFDTRVLELAVVEDGALNNISWDGVEAGVTYFVTVTRDDDGGVNGTGRLTADIRTGSHEGELKAALQVDCAVGKQNDFEFIFALMGRDSNLTIRKCTGFTQNLDLQEVAVKMPVGGETDQVKWRGVQPILGIQGIWPARNATRVAGHHLQEGVGVLNVYTVPSAKRLFLASALISSWVSVGEASRAIMAVRNGDDVFQYYVLYHGFVLAGQQTNGMSYFPALEVEAGWKVYIESTNASMAVRGIIFGWLEDA